MLTWLVAHYVIDAWTATHFFEWALLGCTLAGRSWSWQYLFLAALGLGVGWEVLEAFVVEPLLGFAEPLANRVVDVVVDMAGAVVGALLGRRR